jgi:SAM-dependent methyltransferase
MARRSELDRYTSSDYRMKNPTWHEEHAPWKATHIADLLQRVGSRPQTVVDVGCGTGAVLSALAGHLRSATSLVGYEPSPDAFNDARHRSTDRVSFRNELFDAAGLDEPVDVVLLIDVLEHMENPFGFLRSLHDVTSLVVAHVPLDLSVQAVLRMAPILARRQMVGHIHWFTAELVREMFVDNGYDMIAHEYTAGALDFPAVTPLSGAARLPRRIARRISEPMTARVLGGFSMLVAARPRSHAGV